MRMADIYGTGPKMAKWSCTAEGVADGPQCDGTGATLGRVSGLADHRDARHDPHLGRWEDMGAFRGVPVRSPLDGSQGAPLLLQGHAGGWRSYSTSPHPDRWRSSVTCWGFASGRNSVLRSWNAGGHMERGKLSSKYRARSRPPHPPLSRIRPQFFEPRSADLLWPEHGAVGFAGRSGIQFIWSFL